MTNLPPPLPPSPCQDLRHLLEAVCGHRVFLEPSPSTLEAKLAAESFEHLPLTAAQTRQVAASPWHHRDPFDRMLVAQAQLEGLILLTADDVVTLYGDFVRLVR